MAATPALKLAELPPGTAKTVTVGGKTLALYNVDGRVYASDNACPHRGGALGEGMLEGGLITCPWHGWQWDVAKGCLSNNPKATMATYPARIEGDSVWVEI